MATSKKVVLHPLTKTGELDTNINLYPKTLATGIVNADGTAFTPQAELPKTSTPNKVLISTSVPGVIQWGDSSDGFVEKTTEVSRLYGTDASGAQNLYRVGQNFTAGYTSVPLRNFNGNITVGLNPTSAGEATSKQYVDNSLSNCYNKEELEFVDYEIIP